MWNIEIHTLVFEEDFKKIDSSMQQVILKAIEKKLSVDPENYGTPLRNELKGFWKLPISNYRVIYRIEKQQVKILVVKIGIRRDFEVYKEMIPRMKKLFIS
ncbi:MAG: type II toxin-antitoxin system RelE/ParE family toxin [Candidatus Firestonebacteria bacterium]